MRIFVNGEPCTVDDGCTAADLLEHLDLRHRRVAMEINGRVQPRSGYAERRLTEGDRIEIVHAIGGG